MATLNRIQLLGNIGSVDIKEFNNGKIVNATLATSDRYTDREGNKQEETIWHRITFIGKLADIASQFVEKGDPVLVEGKMRYRKYTAQDGKEVSVAEVLASNLQMLKPRSEKAPAEPKFKPIEKPAPSFDEGEADELPF